LASRTGGALPAELPEHEVSERDSNPRPPRGCREPGRPGPQQPRLV